jgi:NAD(P)-dependent dehydrogenase (short-subunit alcohol dehydrogenase family)
MNVPELRKVEREMAGKLEGKVAIVTGGNSGIGLATAKEFRREGARVVITGRDERTLAAAAREIDGDVLALRSDASSLADIDELFAAVKERFGRVDVLFVNAGVAQFAPLEETEETLFDHIMDINFKGAYFTVKKALPLLSNGASVILNASVVAHVGFPNSSVYSASKAALLSLVRTLSADLAGRGIRVNAVSPGPVETPIFGRMGLPEEAKQGFGEQVPLKRLGRPEEIAKAVLFLASPDSSFLVGTEIVADGGIIGLKLTELAASQEPALRAEAA